MLLTFNTEQGRGARLKAACIQALWGPCWATNGPGCLCSIANSSPAEAAEVLCVMGRARCHACGGCLSRWHSIRQQLQVCNAPSQPLPLLACNQQLNCQFTTFFQIEENPYSEWPSKDCRVGDGTLPLPASRIQPLRAAAPNDIIARTQGDAFYQQVCTQHSLLASFE